VQFTKTPVEDHYGQVSPDGHWLAYASGERGQSQIYVQPLPQTGALWLVSRDGGSMPRWRRDGKELFFRSGDAQLMAVSIGASASGGFEHGPAQSLFGPIPNFGNVVRFTYDASIDGQKFLVATPVATSIPALTVVLNWQAGLGR
jgi:hypothetical protein